MRARLLPLVLGAWLAAFPGRGAAAPADPALAAGASAGPRLVFLPKRPLFDPLLADPRWPRVSGSMVRYDGERGRVFAANLGVTVPLLGGPARGGGLWQWGAQASAFTLWNRDFASNEQLEADYHFALPFSWRWRRLSAQARLSRVSSQLGAGYMLRHPEESRVGLAYESFDALLSYAATPSIRLYGGAGTMLRSAPAGVAPGFLQAGAEYAHPAAFWKGRLRPVLALDLQKHQKSGWGATDVSARAGVELVGGAHGSRRALLMLEYYRGKDPNGQFFRRDAQHAGLGLTLYY